MGTLCLSNAGGHSAGRADYTHWGPGSMRSTRVTNAMACPPACDPFALVQVAGWQPARIEDVVPGPVSQVLQGFASAGLQARGADSGKRRGNSSGSDVDEHVRSSRIEGDIVPVVGHADDPVECVAAELDEGFGEWKGRAIEAGLAGGPVEAVVEIGADVKLVE